MSRPSREKIDTPFASDVSVAEVVAAFEACTLPYPRWTHRAHLAVAAVFVTRWPFADALARARHHIDLYNRTCGDPDGYHETLTVLFLRRVAAEVRVQGSRSLADLVNELTTRCDMTWPLRHYSAEVLWSAVAKAGWVEPDREPLDFE
jgi:hypothetical protein